MPFLIPFLATPLITSAAGAALFTVGNLIGIVGSVGLQLLQSSIAKKEAAKRDRDTRGTELNLRYGLTTRDVVLGTVATKGVLVPPSNAFGPSNDKVEKVYLLSSFRISNINRVFYEGAWCALSGTDPRGKRVQGIAAEIYVRWKIGTMAQTADALLVSNSGGRRASTDVFTGVAYAVVTSIYHRENLSNPADLTFEVTGPLLYDPAGDSTVGGAGLQRWNDESTWAGRADNNALQIYAIRRGLFRGTEKIFGIGLPAIRVPVAQFVLAKSICDETVDSQPRYSCGMICSCGDDGTAGSAIEIAMRAMAGTWIPEIGGGYVQAGATRPVNATLTDADIVWSTDYGWKAARHLSELRNTLLGSYSEPSKGYETTSYGTRVLSTALATDGYRIAQTLDFTGVSNRKQAERLADIYLRSNRYEGVFNGTLAARVGWLKAGDRVRLISVTLGIDLTFEIKRRKERPASDSAAPFAIDVSLQQDSDGAFDASVYTLAPPTPVRPQAPTRVAELASFIPIGTSTTNPDGGRSIPAIQFSIGWPDDVTVTGVYIQWWPDGQPASIGSSLILRPSTNERSSDNVISGSNHWVQYRLITDPDRSAPLTTPVQVNVPLIAEIPIGFPELQTDISETLLRNANLFEEFAARIEQVAYSAAVDTGQSHLDRSVIKREVGGALAQIIKETQLRVSADDALASQITTVQTNVNGANSAITAEATTRANADNALANSVTTVQSSVNGVNAQGLFGIQTQTNPSAGSLVTINMLARASLAGTADQTAWKTSGLSIDLYVDGGVIKSQFLLDATRIVFTDGVNKAPGLVFENGALTLRVAKIGTAIVEELTSENGKLKIRGVGADASITLLS